MPEPSASSTRLRALIRDYLADCRARGLSIKTVRDSYGHALNDQFLPWAEAEGLDLADLTPRALSRYTLHLQEKIGRRGKALSPFSVASYTDSVNFFLAWAGREGELAAMKAKAPRRPRRVLEVLGEDEVERMIAKADLRDQLIVQILWQTGCRASELLGLNIADLVESDRQRVMRLHGPSYGGGAKGNRGRLVPIPRLYRPLRRYIESRRPTDTSSERIFLGRRRRPGGNYEPLTLSGLEQVIRNLAAEAGIERRVYVHLLRHSAITHMLRQGMNPLLVAQIVGHSSLAMIERVYAHLDTNDAYEAMVAMLSRGNGG